MDGGWYGSSPAYGVSERTSKYRTADLSAILEDAAVEGSGSTCGVQVDALAPRQWRLTEHVGVFP